MKMEKKRHLLFKLHRLGPPVIERHLVSAIRSSLHTLYGEVCVATSKLYLDEYDSTNGEGILQCNLENLNEVVAAACMLSRIEETEVSFQPLKLSGSLRSLKQTSH
ncbi:hypothetical protein EU538_03340 [Candidatus Thorarchaeota archaeon]|jgi:RNase P/RNase MRP subunit POP5|nr:MAG: hypothetical protein EU538_03340 [Candidatus Thorarchaeota archaeon]